MSGAGWSMQQQKDFARAAKARVGAAGWAYLSTDQKRSLVAYEIVHVLLGQADEEKYGEIKEMIRGTFLEAGLGPEVM